MKSGHTQRGSEHARRAEGEKAHNAIKERTISANDRLHYLPPFWFLREMVNHPTRAGVYFPNARKKQEERGLVWFGLV